MSTETTEDFEGFVGANYDGGKFENFTVKEGETDYRIFPGVKSMAGKDYLLFWHTHFWKGRDTRDSSKTRFVPILCLQERDWNRGGIVTKTDALCEKREEKKAKIKQIEGKGAEQKRSKAAFARPALLAPTSKFPLVLLSRNRQQ